MILWRNDGRYRGWRFFTFISLGFLYGCESVELGSLSIISSSPEAGGIVVADDPQAALIAQQVLDGGGSATDAAVALGFGLAVTLPSSAGLGGAGACIVYDSATHLAEYLDFKPEPAVDNLEHARWQVSIPALAAGLFALHAKYGTWSWAQVVSPAETYSRFNKKVGRALAKDIEKFSDTLTSDQSVLDAFMSSDRTLAGEGTSIQQVMLTSTLGRIREKTATDFYTGELGRDISQASQVAGTSLGITDLKSYRPNWSYLNGKRVQGVVLYSVSKSQTIYPTEDINLKISENGATTGFAVADAVGNAVVCQLTMTTPFGLGLMLNEVGFLVAPVKEESIEGKSALPPMAIAIDENNGRLSFAGVSKELQGGGVLMTAVTQSLGSKSSSQFTLRQRGMRNQAGYPGVNMLYCKNGLISSFANCEVYKDPLGDGYGIISFGEP